MNVPDDFPFLIERFKEGEQFAFKHLYDMYWQKVTAFATLYIRNKEDIQDIVQDIFIKVWENREKLNAANNFEGYLFIITRNYIFNLKRKLVNLEFIDITLLSIIDKLQDVEAEAIAQDVKKHIDSVIENLPPQRREIFRLSKEEHKTHKKIAEMLNITEKSVEYNISQALQEIRVKMKGTIELLIFVLWNIIS